jgi:hypothetical protein
MAQKNSAPFDKNYTNFIFLWRMVESGTEDVNITKNRRKMK